jgi:glucose/arabinose dehydrogenase
MTANWATRFCICAGALTVALLLAPQLADAEVSLPGGFRDTIAFGNLEQPTNFRFASDGKIFVAEKTGIIDVFNGLEDKEPTVFADLRTNVYDSNDRGLLGLALDPEFPTKPYVYALYTYDHELGNPSPPPRWGQPDHSGDACLDPQSACLVSGRLVRLEANVGADHAVPSAAAPAEDVLIEDWCAKFSSHSIGDLQFGPEGALFASGGEGASFENADYGQLDGNACGDPHNEGGSLRAQDIRTPADPTGLDGAIVRVDPETGDPLPDNPLYATGSDENAKRIVAFGFRNPFRFTVNPETGELYSDNVGSSQFESIDRFPTAPSTAFNFGWPCYEGPGPQYEFRTLTFLSLCQSLYEEEEGRAEGEPRVVTPPFFTYSHRQVVAPGDECAFTQETEPGSAIAGISFYRGLGDYPAPYDGALFFADTVRGCIYVMRAGEDGRPDPFTVSPFFSETVPTYPGVDIEEGPEGDLYYASLYGPGFGPGAIHRISYDPHSPVAKLTAKPPWGPASVGHPLEVEFDASESEDPDGKPLEYEWDLDGNGTFETKTSTPEESAAFTKAENVTVSVRVVDAEAHTAVAHVTVYPGDEPPTPEIKAPAPSLRWRAGQEIEFKGSSGSSEGQLDETSLDWSTRIYHCPSACHTHPLQNFPGVKEGSFIAPEHDLPSRIEITLNAADSRGLSASATVLLEPKEVSLGIVSEPPGVPLTVGTAAQPAPYTYKAIEDSHVSVSAPPSVQIDGRSYAFTGWSDGGSAAHTILATGDGTYTARYSTPETQPPVVEPPRHPSFETKLRKHPAKVTRSRKAAFAFDAAGAGGFRCKLDAHPFKACRSPLVYRHLKPGRHTFVVIAVSADGAVDGPRTVYAWKIRAPR